MVMLLNTYVEMQTYNIEKDYYDKICIIELIKDPIKQKQAIELAKLERTERLKQLKTKSNQFNNIMKKSS